jgi:hypothetical protein
MAPIETTLSGRDVAEKRRNGAGRFWGQTPKLIFDLRDDLPFKPEKMVFADSPVSGE